jgi:hypothetical protein
MKVLNEKMFNLIYKIPHREHHLDKHLESIIEAGFKELNGYYFISSLVKNSQSVIASDFPDKAGFECFVNSIHIDDYVDTDFLQQGLLFVEKVFEVWNDKNKSLPLVGVISKTEFGANVKFYFQRPNEVYINITDIDKFEDPVLISFYNYLK